MVRLAHYTCVHGRKGIGDIGELHPGPDGFVWLTDMLTPNRDALGLTMHYTTCDRTRYRYRVTVEPDQAGIVHWPVIRRRLPALYVETIEGTTGARPMHWWVSTKPVPVRFEGTTHLLASKKV